MTTKHYVFILLTLLCASSFLSIIFVSQTPLPWFPNQFCLTVLNISTQEKNPSVLTFQRSFNLSISKNSSCRDGELIYGLYCTVSFWKMGARSKSHSNQVTLCTQGTQEFLHHISPLCSRWQGPISVAVYCSSQEDYNDATRRILTLRECDSCVHSWVDWHLFFSESHQPYGNVTRSVQECGLLKANGNSSEKPQRSGTYPINIGRNLARWNAKTMYVFPSDIELYPSHNVLYRFELMLKSNSSLSNGKVPEVYVFPVFEVYSKFEPPNTKSELRKMIKRRSAISFHKFRCDICHRIPNLAEWLNYPLQENPVDGVTEQTNFRHEKPFRIWKTVRRNKIFHLQYWEPFFIAKNTIPEFDYRLSWEGKQNKMQLAYEMCLSGYDFHILDEAYLVHAPGVNMYRASKEKFRRKHAAKNSAIMKKIKLELAKKFGPNKEC